MVNFATAALLGLSAAVLTDAGSALCALRVCPSHSPPITPVNGSFSNVKDFTSLHDARDAARGLRRQPECPTVEVTLCPGVYTLATPLLLTLEDSNTVWRSEATVSGATATISAGVSVEGWVPEKEMGPRVHSAPIPPGLGQKTPESAAFRHMWAANTPDLSPPVAPSVGSVTVAAVSPGPAGVHAGDTTWRRLQRASIEGIPETCGTFTDYASGCMSFRWGI